MKADFEREKERARRKEVNHRNVKIWALRDYFTLPTIKQQIYVWDLLYANYVSQVLVTYKFVPHKYNVYRNHTFVHPDVLGYCMYMYKLENLYWWLIPLSLSLSLSLISLRPVSVKLYYSSESMRLKRVQGLLNWRWGEFLWMLLTTITQQSALMNTPP